MIISVVLLVNLCGTVADVESALQQVLEGGPATSADVQRELSRLMGWSAASSRGVVVGGRRASIRDLDAQAVQQEVGSDAPIREVFEVSGEGPEPLRVHVPVKDAPGEIEVYRHMLPGVYVRVEEPRRASAGYLSFKATAPGRFVVREVDAYSYPDAEKCLFDFTPPSDDPAAKADWRFYRMEPDRITGPIPLVLISGMGTDRWANFAHWAAHSPEAELLRTRFQVWDYHRTSEGVDAAIGFSPAYPGFEESIVAYLDRFIRDAMQAGVETEGVRYFFPDGPFTILTHSHGGLVARAFLKNFPDHAERVIAVVTLNAPHMGTPFATPEWLRHTVSRLGFCAPKLLGLMLESTVAQWFLTGWISTGRQSDMDLGWGNYDVASGYGLPCEDFRVFRWAQGFTTLTVSLRDANRTGARDLPGCVDDTFEPPELLSTYCGGLDEIMPRARGDLYTDKFFVYGSYLVPEEGFIQQTLRNVCGVFDWFQVLVETAGLGISHTLMGAVETPGTDVPLGAYRLGDGLVPLQSQLMLDGQEGELIYKTHTVFGWRLPTFLPEPKEDLISAHTLADPHRLRILRGWSHLETVSGRYNATTGHSELFGLVAGDLLGAVNSSSDTAYLPRETRHE